MKNFIYETHWDEIKGQLKQRYGQLTNDDVAFVKGKGEELLARLREKLGMSGEDLHGVLSELNSSAGDGLEKAKAKLGGMADDMRDRVSAVVDDVRAKATAAAEDVKEQATAVYGQARERARGYFADGEEYVRHNPRHSILAALCAGFVAGMLIRR